MQCEDVYKRQREITLNAEMAHAMGIRTDGGISTAARVVELEQLKIRHAQRHSAATGRGVDFRYDVVFYHGGKELPQNGRVIEHLATVAIGEGQVAQHVKPALANTIEQELPVQFKHCLLYTSRCV